jgi:WD40 repeat protein
MAPTSEAAIPTPYDQFGMPVGDQAGYGWSIDVDAGKTIIGGPWGGPSGGGAHILDNVTGDTLLAFSTPAGATQFGEFVSLGGNRALVSNDPDRRAYLYNATTGQQIAVLTDPTTTILGFSNGLAVSSDLAVVGNPYAGDGKVRIYDANNGSFRRQIVHPSAFGSAEFGIAIEIVDDRLLVGAPNAPGASSSDGAVYVYNANSGALVNTLTGPPTVNFYDFGQSIDVSGDLVVVGAPQQSFGPGAAYLFDLSTGQRLRALLPPPDLNVSRFGHSVAVSGNLALVGAWASMVEGLDGHTGYAFLYDVLTGDLIKTFHPFDERGELGYQVAFAGDRALFSAPGVGNGRVYSVQVPEPSTSMLLLTALVGLAGSGNRRSVQARSSNTA